MGRPKVRPNVRSKERPYLQQKVYQNTNILKHHQGCHAIRPLRVQTHLSSIKISIKPTKNIKWDLNETTHMKRVLWDLTCKAFKRSEKFNPKNMFKNSSRVLPKQVNHTRTKDEEKSCCGL